MARRCSVVAAVASEFKLVRHLSYAVLGVSLAGLELRKTLRSKRYEALIGILVAKREAAGMTQSDLAARLGKSRSVVARIESGQRRITVVEFMALAKILRFDPYKVVSTLEKL